MDRRTASGLKILHVIASLAPRYGGPSKVLPEMCGALARRGHDVEIFTTNIDGEGELAVPTGVPLKRESVVRTYFPIQRPRRYAASLPLARALQTRIPEFDLAHVHSLYLFHGAIAGHVCRRRGIPYVLRPHGTLDRYHRSVRHGRKALYDVLIERRNLANAAAIQYTSERERSEAEETGLRTPGYVIPHGITIEPPGREEHLGSRQDHCVAFLGRITEKKGIDLLCRAFALVAAEKPTATLVIAGPDDEGLGREIRRELAGLGIEGMVAFPGLVEGPAKAKVLREATVFVLPSRDENFGITVAEAMAAGTPVVISPEVAIHASVGRGGAGFVVPRTAQAIAEAILRVLEDPALAAQLGERGRQLVRTEFSWDSAAERLEAMYRYALAHPRPMRS